MTTSKPSKPTAASTTAARVASAPPVGNSLAGRPTRSPLLTETEVLAGLKAEIAATSLTAVARKYSDPTREDGILQPSQISDILYGRANLSPRVQELLKLKLHKFYERVKK